MHDLSTGSHSSPSRKPSGGFQLTSSVDDPNPVGPVFFDDGSTSDETKAWALKNLGFIDTPGIKFEYSVGLKNKNGEIINICPAHVTQNDLTLYLYPSSRPGFFYCRYGGIKKIDFLTSEYSAPTVEKLFDDVTAAIAQIKQKWPNSFTRNVYKDPRYVAKKTFWMWVFKKHKEWFYDGKQCKVVEGWLAGEKIFYYAEFDGDQSVCNDIIKLAETQF